MCSKGAIHIFIGAPNISPALAWGSDKHPSDGQKTKWEETTFTCSEQGAYLQNASNSKRTAHHELLEGTLYRKQHYQTSFCYDRSALQNVTSKYKSKLVQKMDSDIKGIVSNLVSSTNSCNITPSFHKHTGDTSDVLHACLDASHLEDHNDVKTNTNIVMSAETEFLTVLTSSQVAVQGHVNIFDQDVFVAHNETKTVSTDRQDNSASSLKVTLSDKTTAESASNDVMQDYFACSLELFTQISDHGSNNQVSTFHQSDKCQVNVEGLEKDTASVIELSNHLGSASCKRKKVITTSFSPVKNYLKFKKPKKSTSSVKCPTKWFDEHREKTPVISLTLLRQCSDKTREYNILAVVMHPCYVKEILVKSGPNVGSCFPLATIIVLDHSEAERKVLMWRTAAFWSLALFPGDIIMLTNLKVFEDRWNENAFLQSTFRSKLINLGGCSTLLPEESSNMVDYSILKELMDYIHIKHYYLRELPPRQPQKLDSIQYVRIAQLQPELLVHSILKVKSISILKESTYQFKGLQQNKIILTVEEVKEQTGTLILWGASISWCDHIRCKRDHIWVFKYLFSQKNLFSGDIELHTTPWSSCECLFDDDKRAIDFQKQYIENVSPTKQLSLKAIIEDQYSGEIQVKASISELEFHIPGNKKIFITYETSITDILMSLSAIIYLGCEKCKTELEIDENHVYEQCFICLPFNQVRTFYRPALMTIMSEDSSVCVHVPSDILEKIFLNISPNLLHIPAASFTDVTYGAVVADLCHSLLAETRESYLFLIRSHFLLDENSIPLEQEFHVLDFHLDV
ncbi:shieldin complex subunit 2 [Mixophyes fleayi]|uniref:shieldin complex subunit 2 n=1 Tax=Mixophyes fleayi TaxID=3061075 RepID=UPI003F4DE401